MKASYYYIVSWATFFLYILLTARLLSWCCWLQISFLFFHRGKVSLAFVTVFWNLYYFGVKMFWSYYKDFVLNILGVRWPFERFVYFYMKSCHSTTQYISYNTWTTWTESNFISKIAEEDNTCFSSSEIHNLWNSR